MKKIFAILILIMVLFNNGIIKAQYIYLNNGKFKLNNKDFYPMILNYDVGIRKTSQNEYWIASTGCYGNTNEFEANSRLEALAEFKANFQMVKDMGFNTVRLCGINPTYNFDYATNKNGLIYMTSGLLDPGKPIYNNREVQEELTPVVRTKMFSFISDVLNIAADRGIKILLLCGGPDANLYRDKYADYLEALADNFKNNTALLGYDLFNEPTYFSKMDEEGLSKIQICGIVSDWISRMKAVDPNHLITVGFASSFTVAGWDPELIPVDFASFHPYGTSNHVGNEIYWYTKNMKKPWIIGETGLSADVQRYEEQKQFASAALKRCANCGGSGFSWWQYQDVWWDDYESNFYGLLNHEGITSTTVSGLSIQGTPKPAVDVFKNFATYIPDYVCNINSNYYNESSSNKKRVSGKIINNSTNAAVEGAVIYGRDVNYQIISSTFSHSDGSFELYTDSETTISIITYDYLKMDNGKYYLSEIDNTNPQNLNNLTINIGQSQIFNSQNSIALSNININGDGTNGGTMTLSAPLYIKFNSNTKVDRGARLNVSTNRVLTTSLKLTPLNNCGGLPKNPKIDNKPMAMALSSSNKDDDHNLMIYPNPTDGLLYIQSNNNELKTIELYSACGELMFSENTNNNYATLDISKFVSGIYALRICTRNGCKFKKIIRR